MNIMILLGFGCLMASYKLFSWSSLIYNFILNAFIVQFYVLFYHFWKRVILDGFYSGNYYIYAHEKTMIYGLHSSASFFIHMGTFVGRVGPLELLIMSIVHVFGYTLNEVLCKSKIIALDSGGGMTVHIFGAFAGITASLILKASSRPTIKPKSNYMSHIFGIIGTIIIWMYFPSFNFGFGFGNSTEYN